MRVELGEVGDAVRSSNDAISDLCSAMRVDLVRLAAVLVDDGGLAEEIVQDAFAALCRRWPHLADPAAAAAYVRRCVVNAGRSEIRRRMARRRRPMPAAMTTVDSPESAVVLAAEHRAVVAAVHRLPRRQREVVILRYWQGLAEAEIAATMAISTGSVKSAASRGLDAVQRQIGRSIR